LDLFGGPILSQNQNLKIPISAQTTSNPHFFKFYAKTIDFFIQVCYNRRIKYLWGIFL